MRRLCGSRLVWRNLLSKLEDEEAPCLPSHVSIDSLSTPELRRTVMGGLRSKVAWHRNADIFKPSSIRELRLPNFSANRQEWSTRMDVRLLPGGNQVLVENRNVIELWSVEQREMLGATPACIPHDMCLAFDFEVARGGKELVIAAVFIDTETCQWLVPSVCLISTFCSYLQCVQLCPCFLFRLREQRL